MPLKLLLNGARGRMGIAIAAIAEDNNAEIVSACDVGDDPHAKIDTCEAIIEFSFHEVTLSIAELAVEKNTPLVIGTTGYHHVLCNAQVAVEASEALNTRQTLSCELALC